MCAIAGLFGPDRHLLGGLLGLLRHRGPDARATLDLPELGGAIGHARLSIIDPDARSNQPFVSDCGRYALTFNGEIYNYVELRGRLRSRGHDFRTESDTEVLLRWLIELGPTGLADLEGMYALCLVDRHARSALLARDPIGEKPLYYALSSPHAGYRLAFASELKALVALPDLDTSLDSKALADYLRFLYTAAPHTLYRGIRELAPGHHLLLSTDDPRDEPIRHYDLAQRIAQNASADYAHSLQRLRTELERSVRLRLRADVPVGLYLSGGLDSNSILGLARRLEPSAALATYTMRFEGSRLSRSLSEGELAARAAHWHGVTNLQQTFDERSGLLETLERMSPIFDQPFGNATCIVAEQLASVASRHGRVCLVGDGGDELLAGYPRYRALSLYQKLQRSPRLVRAALQGGAAMLYERGRFATSARRLRQFSRGLSKPMADCFIDWSTYTDAAGLERALGVTTPTPFHASLTALFERHQSDPLRAAALVDFHSFVPFNLLQAADRTSMAHGLELRTPFLAPALIEAALSMPAQHKLQPGRTKPLLEDALSDVLPPFVKHRRKHAFNPPLQGFVRANLRELEDYLLGPGARTRELLDRRFVQGELTDFQRGARDNSTFLWGLGSLECWLRAGTRGRRINGHPIPRLVEVARN